MGGQAEIAPSSNPLFIPMESVPPEVQDEIWTRILYFALEIDHLDADLASPVHVPKRSIAPAVQVASRYDIMLVSKQFKV